MRDGFAAGELASIVAGEQAGIVVVVPAAGTVPVVERVRGGFAAVALAAGTVPVVEQVRGGSAAEVQAAGIVPAVEQGPDESVAAAQDASRVRAGFPELGACRGCWAGLGVALEFPGRGVNLGAAHSAGRERVWQVGLRVDRGGADRR